MSFFPVHVPRRRLPPYQSFVFDGVDDILRFAWASTATNAERRVWTASMWVRINLAINGALLWQAISADETQFTFSAIEADGVFLDHSGEGMRIFSAAPPDNNVWTHYVFRVDTTLANGANRFRIYRNGSLLSPDDLEAPPQNMLTMLFQSGGFFDLGGWGDVEIYHAARLAFVDVVSGQSLGPGEFAVDRGGTWTRKRYEGSYGNFGFSLDGTQGFNDVSGNGFHFNNEGGVGLDPVDLPPLLN